MPSKKRFVPDPERTALELLLKHSVDTDDWTTDRLPPEESEYAFHRAESKLTGVASPVADGLQSFHVTDDPSQVEGVLRSKASLTAHEGDFCPGLYVSEHVNIWKCRSRKKWDFLKSFTIEQHRTLAKAVMDELFAERGRDYITQSEFESGVRTIAQYQETGYYDILSIVAGQPYNINIQTLVKRLNLAEPFEPCTVPVIFTGRYLEWNERGVHEAIDTLLQLQPGGEKQRTQENICGILQRYGWDGVYTKAGFGTESQLNLWNPEKIVRFHGYPGDAPELSGPQDRAIFIPGERFEASVSASRGAAALHDRKLKGIFDLMSRGDLEELAEIVFRMQEGDVALMTPRFASGILFGSPQIMDRKFRTYFRGLKPQDLDELRLLIGHVLGEMS